MRDRHGAHNDGKVNIRLLTAWRDACWRHWLVIVFRAKAAVVGRLLVRSKLSSD